MTEERKVFPEEFQKILPVVAAFNPIVETKGNAVTLSVRVQSEDKTFSFAQLYSMQVNHKPASTTIDNTELRDVKYKEFITDSFNFVNMGIRNGAVMERYVKESDVLEVKDYEEFTNEVYEVLLANADLNIMKNNLVSFKLLNSKQLTDRQHYELNSLIVEIDKVLNAGIETEEERY